MILCETCMKHKPESDFPPLSASFDKKIRCKDCLTKIRPGKKHSKIKWNAVKDGHRDNSTWMNGDNEIFA